VLDRTDEEPFTRSATTIIHDNDILKMWYVSDIKWANINSTFHPKRLYPEYVIRYATSSDGICWRAENTICINFESADEFGFGRPWAIKDDHTYKMWYSIRSRSQPYRIGYAESEDGIHWTRKDEQVGIEKSESGWDSEMICYPCVVDAKGKRYLFYNGNQHGSSGFGYAVLESE
jgi:hypothetical protein